MSLFRHALRQFARAPMVTAIAVLSLALGIGANAVVFSWLESIVLRPLAGVRDGDRMVVVLNTVGGKQTDHCVSPPDLTDYAELTDIFAGVIGSQVTPACLTIDHKPVWLYGQIATANIFDVLGVQPLPGLGRTFLPSDGDKPGGNPVVVLSERAWRQHFAADPAAVGRSIEINKQPFTIIGVVPAAFSGTMGGLLSDFWAPVTMHREVANFGSLTYRNDRWMHTQARLQPGVSLAQARAALEVRARQIAETHPENRDIGAIAVELADSPYGGQAIFRPVLRVLSIVGLLVVLLVSANVANLLLARATARQRDTAVRLAIGAGRRHILGEWFAESLVLAVAGGGLGLILSVWGTSLFGMFIPETAIPVGYDFAPSARVLGAVLVLTLTTGLGFGLVPALHAARANVQEVLKQGGRSATGSSSARVRGALVITEVALALVLLVTAALCIRGSARAREINPGFDPDGVLISSMRIGMNGYDETRALSFYRDLREHLAHAAGVEVAAMASWFPLGFEGGPSIGVRIDGYTPAQGENMSIPYTIVSPDYFAAMRIALQSGRDFTDLDTRESQPVVIINQAAADKYWPGMDPLGHTLKTWRGTATVVGVVATGKYRELDESPRPFIYLPYLQGVWDLNLGIVVRSASAADPRSLIGAVRAEVHQLDPSVELWSALPLTEYVRASYLRHTIATRLLTGLGFVAMILASVGIYGVMAYHVTQRVPEIGVRMALGARPADIRRMVLSAALRLLVPGLVAGLLLAWWAGSIMAHSIPGVEDLDPVADIVVALALSLVAVVACWIPARRAAAVDPLAALRSD